MVFVVSNEIETKKNLRVGACWCIDFSPYFVTDIEECNMTWITLYFEERILNVKNNRLNFVVFVVTHEKKQKKIEGLVHVRVVHLSCSTGLSPWTGGHCFVHQPIP